MRPFRRSGTARTPASSAGLSADELFAAIGRHSFRADQAEIKVFSLQTEVKNLQTAVAALRTENDKLRKECKQP